MVRIDFFKGLAGVLMLFSFICIVFASCEERQTYAEQKKAERRAIGHFISNGTLCLDEEVGDTLLFVKPIKVISEEQFLRQDSTTNLRDNEYVLLSSAGVYMQIVRKGTGSKLEDGQTARILNRYIEFNISGDSIQLRNNNAHYIGMLDEMTVTNVSGSFTASFNQGLMKARYTSAQVPEGWLVPLHYINIGRQDSDEGEIAKVRIIVPHSSGQQDALKNVYPCFYELTYVRSR